MIMMLNYKCDSFASRACSNYALFGPLAARTSPEWLEFIIEFIGSRRHLCGCAKSDPFVPLFLISVMVGSFYPLHISHPSGLSSEQAISCGVIVCS